ncbi:hypothetical protein D9V37_05305 [Nocardioides mangrovicus]|uniref:Uncharacterized protein n=1 Tax=Nocardioides mangrovicus TaxID=2478913 RepID=A0A3L8P4D3_9ACTN|nr:hypothetical protein D9V37_05305 [Nocardioides mangrovicus]
MPAPAECAALRCQRRPKRSTNAQARPSAVPFTRKPRHCPRPRARWLRRQLRPRVRSRWAHPVPRPDASSNVVASVGKN